MKKLLIILMFVISAPAFATGGSVAATTSGSSAAGLGPFALSIFLINAVAVSNKAGDECAKSNHTVMLKGRNYYVTLNNCEYERLKGDVIR